MEGNALLETFLGRFNGFPRFDVGHHYVVHANAGLFSRSSSLGHEIRKITIINEYIFYN